MALKLNFCSREENGWISKISRAVFMVIECTTWKITSMLSFDIYKNRCKIFSKSQAVTEMMPCHSWVFINCKLQTSVAESFLLQGFNLQCLADITWNSLWRIFIKPARRIFITNNFSPTISWKLILNAFCKFSMHQQRWSLICFVSIRMFLGTCA